MDETYDVVVVGAGQGRGWTSRYNHTWLTSLGIYRLTGTVRYRQAHAAW